MTPPANLPQTLIAVVILLTVAVTTLVFFRVRLLSAAPIAILRAALQLAIVSVLLTGVISSPVWVGVALLVMLVAAAFTAAQRVGFTWRRLAAVAASIAGSSSIALVVVFATGAIDFAPRYMLAIGGIVIGNCMTVASLAGQRMTESVALRWDEVEGWLSLGATPRRSTAELARLAVARALTPTIDQTKTSGLVTLPGAFVGAVFAGASPLEAGRFQLVVLAAILAAGAPSAVGFLLLDAPRTLKPAIGS
ncbi:MAG: hypothetical protein JWQ12_1480 [Glaciihabitans sp.]|jgi:putative ABC transport system permease protein|nr:hypothetical protein [Glaciihabitans sp.]